MAGGESGGASPEEDQVFVVTVPDGGRCGPARARTDPGATAATEPLGFAADAGSSCEGDGGRSEFSPSTPIGVGYPTHEPFPPSPIAAHVAYLTFDDGPSEWTDAFLDILASRGIHATFFVTSEQFKGPAGLEGTYVDADGGIRVFRDVLKREVDEGHAIGNHTVNHPDLGLLTAQQIELELDENELLMNVSLLHAGGLPQVLSLFRPPFGSPWYDGPANQGDAAACQANAGPEILRHGVSVMWTIDSTDSAEWAQEESFSAVPQSERPSPGAPTYEVKMARIKHAVLGAPEVARGDGFIVLMHDTHDTTRDVLASIVDGLVADGYSFQTIEQYVQGRWSRPSLDLTPGPALFSSCVAEKDQGCAGFGAPVRTDRANEVCGRMWLAYETFGGFPALGAPTGEPKRSPTTGIMSQPFARGTIELHPENPAPCNIVLIPR